MIPVRLSYRYEFDRFLLWPCFCLHDTVTKFHTSTSHTGTTFIPVWIRPVLIVDMFLFTWYRHEISYQYESYRYDFHTGMNSTGSYCDHVFVYMLPARNFIPVRVVPVTVLERHELVPVRLWNFNLPSEDFENVMRLLFITHNHAAIRTPLSSFLAFTLKWCQTNGDKSSLMRSTTCRKLRY